MVEGLRRIDAGVKEGGGDTPGLGAITAVVALDYVRFRFPGAFWMPQLPKVERLREQMRARPSIEETVPHD